MPTYEYKREDGTTFDKRQLMNDDPLQTCPQTGQSVQRIISGGIQTQIKNKIKPMSDKIREEASARKSKTTTLNEYGRMAQDQRKAWEQKKADKKK